MSLYIKARISLGINPREPDSGNGGKAVLFNYLLISAMAGWAQNLYLISYFIADVSLMISFRAL